MNLPRNSELKILPLHTQTPLAQILRTWPIKPHKCFILLAADCLNLLLVFPDDEDTYTHEVSVLIYCCLCDLNTSLETWMELATCRNTLSWVCETLRIVRQCFVQHSTFTLALRLHRTGTEAKAQRKQVIALSSENSNVSIVKGQLEIYGFRIRST